VEKGGIGEFGYDNGEYWKMQRIEGGFMSSKEAIP
jgi:hypothetical protein